MCCLCVDRPAGFQGSRSSLCDEEDSTGLIRTSINGLMSAAWLHGFGADCKLAKEEEEEEEEAQKKFERHSSRCTHTDADWSSSSQLLARHTHKIQILLQSSYLVYAYVRTLWLFNTHAHKHTRKNICGCDPEHKHSAHPPFVSMSAHKHHICRTLMGTCTAICFSLCFRQIWDCCLITAGIRPYSLGVI